MQRGRAGAIHDNVDGEGIESFEGCLDEHGAE
jgi:hypothetical protein